MSQKRPTAFDIPIPATYPDCRKNTEKNKHKKNPRARPTRARPHRRGRRGAPAKRRREAGASKKPLAKP